MYKISYERRICKDLDKIPGADIERILAVFKDLPSNPLPSGSKKLFVKKSLYRIRQGNYRIVYTVDHREKEIKIILVRHRRESYRGL